MNFVHSPKIFSKLIQFNDGEFTYEYDNSSIPLGRGGFGTVFEGFIIKLFINVTKFNANLH